ncbi:hypothetical protein SAMN04488121_102437 [Chitinophaga filiformis]|uniref:Uncharacterized protein n=1 Tax=Chitinophaga filiformis TaxID=104663 RepID=A0A1G7MJJ0_CHIFI|nr:hypothetical protein SAMN04488121_102437 [Chitinophaga filiformis]
MHNDGDWNVNIEQTQSFFIVLAPPNTRVVVKL